LYVCLEHETPNPELDMLTASEFRSAFPGEAEQIIEKIERMSGEYKAPAKVDEKRFPVLDGESTRTGENVPPIAEPDSGAVNGTA
jgi:hypothetical protein